MTVSSTNSIERESDFVAVSGLSKHFGDVKAVQNVSFGVNDGEFFSIIGPSGSGKTTLLRMLAGFETPTEGTIRIDDRDCTTEKPYHRNTNMIFQNLALFPHLTVKENIAYGLVEAGKSQKAIDKKVDDALENVDLTGYGSRQISDLSGGEQQRVALARGLVNEPDVLLLDEPLAALDEKLKETMKVELKRIQDRTGTTFIYVTHDQQVSMAMSDRIAVLRDGKLQQIASPQTLYKNPNNAFVANFTGAKNIFEIDQLDSDGDEDAIYVQGVRFTGDVSIPSGSESSDYRVVLRQEAISVGTTEETVVSGTVTEIVYKGALAEVIIEVDEGSLSLVAEVHYKEVADVERGSSVYLDWSDDSVLLVPK